MLIFIYTRQPHGSKTTSAESSFFLQISYPRDISASAAYSRDRYLENNMSLFFLFRSFIVSQVIFRGHASMFMNRQFGFPKMKPFNFEG